MTQEAPKLRNYTVVMEMGVKASSQKNAQHIVFEWLDALDQGQCLPFRTAIVHPWSKQRILDEGYFPEY